MTLKTDLADAKKQIAARQRGLVTKVLELRDKGTFIPLLAVQMIAVDPEQAYLVNGRAGYPADGSQVMITKLAGEAKASADPFFWNDRTYHVAHEFILKHWNELKDGDVVDVEFILGETKEKKRSERFEFPS